MILGGGKTNLIAEEATLAVRRAWSAGGLSVVVVLAVVWYALGVEPALQQIDAIRSQVDRSLDFLESEQRLREELAETISAHRRLSQQAEHTRTRAVGEVDEVRFLSWLTGLAGETGLSLQDFRPVGGVDYGDYRGRLVLLSATGDYQAVCRVLDGFRQSPRLCRVAELTISPTGSGRADCQLDLRVELLSVVDDLSTHAVAARLD